MAGRAGISAVPSPQPGLSLLGRNQPALPRPLSQPPARGLGTEQPHQFIRGRQPHGTVGGINQSTRKGLKKEVVGEKNQGRGWGERAMEGEWGGVEIKGKNSSEITELFIFPALVLRAFEASTLMYLDILGPSVTGGHPSPTA